MYAENPCNYYVFSYYTTFPICRGFLLKVPDGYPDFFSTYKNG